MCSPKNIKNKRNYPKLQLQPTHATEKPKAASDHRKEVRFNEAVHCRRFRPYASASKKNIWFSQHEKDRAVQEIQDTIQLMDQGIRLDKSKFTSRGLEGIISAEQRLKHRRRVIASVIEEQYRQWEEDGMLKDDQISAVYREQTQTSEIEAQALAARDHHEVRSMILEDMKVHFKKKLHQGSHLSKRSQPTAKPPLPPRTKPLNFGSLAA